MFEDWIVVICGVVVIIIVAAAALLQLLGSESRMHENTHKLRVYTDLLNAITELNLAGGDPYRMDIAKKNPAMTLNRLNLVGSTGVLKSTNDLLDFLNEHKDKEFDTLRLHNILNMVFPDILAEKLVGVRVHFNGHDLARPGMNRHLECKITNSGKHIHNELVLTKKAHVHAFLQVAGREHHFSGIQIEDHSILPMHRLRLETRDRLAHWLPEPALDAIVA